MAYIAFAQAPITREQRVAEKKSIINRRYSDYNQQQFLNFVLDQYVEEGVRELDQDKLPDLLELKYHGVADAAAELGGVATIREVFIGFQRYLYE